MKQRKLFAIALAGALLLSLASCGKTAASGNSSSDPPAGASDTQSDSSNGIAATTAGQVQGTEQNGIYRYLGVPYAQAKERFVPAEDVEPWEGVLTPMAPCPPRVPYLAWAAAVSRTAPTTTART